ncbi:MAG TPA: ATP-binding protein [Pyrinomonadaceae bacterium]|nr:ATP-binding protein [Pyrinomonadaceae bacterium]
MIFKESLNNIVRHSQCTKVGIDFRVESGRLLLRISDNGEGFETAVATDGNGLGNMRRRAEELNGQLALDSKVDEGTTVRLSVPIDGHRKFL